MGKVGSQPKLCNLLCSLLINNPNFLFLSFDAKLYIFYAYIPTEIKEMPYKSVIFLIS